MLRYKTRTRTTLLVTTLAAALPLLNGCGSSGGIAEGTTVQLALLETTDLHSNVLGYNYYSLSADTTVGMDRTATLITSARSENPNNVLLDDGDVIQGTLLGDYQAVASPVPCSDTLAVHKAMNALKFDGGGMGNHEFNYGLTFLSQVTNRDFGIASVPKPNGCGSPTFPLVLTNVSSVGGQKPIFDPYKIITKTFSAVAPGGSTVQVPIKIGIMSFVPPQIMSWDAKNLTGLVSVDGPVESAKKYVPEIRSNGADLVVALSHGGLDASAYSPNMENAGLYLSQTGIDALLLGHAHLIFPQAKETGGPAIDPSIKALPASQVDYVNGFVNGVPAVMAQSWGRRLGIIKMTLKYQGGKWVVQKDKTTTEARGFKYTDGKTNVAADPTFAPLVAKEHDATIAYAQQPLGATTDFEMSAFFALVGDVSAIQIVNQAQIDYVKTYIAKALPAKAGIPVISCSAPFKAGRNGPTDFTDVTPSATSSNPASLQVRNPGDLYLYSNNNVQAVQIKGADLKNWLETSAKQFAQIDPTSTAEQDLVPSYATIYNYDVFYAENNALTYQIDVTQPIGSRIVHLMYAGAAVDPNADFIVATNDYRAGGGGNFPGIDGSKTIIKSPDANQTVVSNYLRSIKVVTRAGNDTPSWSFAKVTTAGPVILRSQSGKLAVAQALGLARVTAEGAQDASGYAKYAIDLGK